MVRRKGSKDPVACDIEVHAADKVEEVDNAEFAGNAEAVVGTVGTVKAPDIVPVLTLDIAPEAVGIHFVA